MGNITVTNSFLSYKQNGCAEDRNDKVDIDDWFEEMCKKMGMSE